MARLEVLEGFNPGSVFELSSELTLGRSPDNTVCLPDNRASRFHARVLPAGERFALEDMGSANGTVLGGKLIDAGIQYPLKHHDEFWVGTTCFRYISDTPEEDMAEKPAGQHDFGNMSIVMSSDEMEEDSPAVNMTIDASMSMMEVDEEEQQSAEGLQEAIKRFRAMLQISDRLGAVLDQNELMDRLLENIFDIFPTADRAFVLLRIGDGEEATDFVPVAARSRREDDESHEEIRFSSTILREVVSKKQSLVSADTQSDDQFSNQMSLVNLAIKSFMCAPLIVQDEILGVIQVDSSSGAMSFSKDDLKMLTSIGSQAGIAVKNAQLYDAVETETQRRTSLQRYFSPNMVEMMMSGDVNQELGGKTYTGTVFFSDIIGFTSMSESMAAPEVVANLNRYFRIMQKLIYDNGGNVDKFEGDAIMAFWSVPRALEDDEFKATLAGVQMQGHLWPFVLDLVKEGQKPIYMGIGINTGDFVAGNIGSEDKIEFTLIGDTVNLTARIESLAGRYNVFVSRATYEAIADRVAAVQLPPTQVKGKSMDIDIFSIRAMRTAPDAVAVGTFVDVLDDAGEERGNGVFTSGVLDGDTPTQFAFSTNAPLTAGEKVVLRPSIREYHTTSILEATVKSADLGSHTGGCEYTKAILGDLDGEEALSFFVPGRLHVTERTWETITRK